MKVIRKHYRTRDAWWKERFWSSQLNAHGFETARSIDFSTTGSEGPYWIDFEWLEGEPATIHQIDKMKQQLDRFSEIGNKIRTTYAIDAPLIREEKCMMTDRFKHQLAPFYDSDDFWNMYKEQWSKQRFGVIHRDPHYCNWICHQDQVYIIDFGLVSYGPALYDVAYIWANECKSVPFSIEKMQSVWNWVQVTYRDQSFLFFLLFFFILEQYGAYYQTTGNQQALDYVTQWTSDQTILLLIGECIECHKKVREESKHI